MAKTAVADIIVPSLFEKYAIERTAQLSVFAQSGIIEHAPEFDELASMGGRTVEMPFWNELLIFGAVAIAVGGWFLAHRHGKLQGFVDANKNGIDDALEFANGSEKRPDNS